MLRDQFRLRRQQKQIREDKQKGKDVTERLTRWNDSLQKSIELRERRTTNLPTPALDAELPIAIRADEIGEAIRNNQVVVISGETGSGKSTQLPLICLQLGLGVGGFIGHTQPRRIAARGVAAWRRPQPERRK